MITLRARGRFLARDWRESYGDAAERLHLYARQMEELTQQIRKIMGTRLCERSVWTGDQGRVFVAHRAIQSAGNRGELFQFANAARLCDRGGGSGNRIRRHRFRRSPGKFFAGRSASFIKAAQLRRCLRAALTDPDARVLPKSIGAICLPPFSSGGTDRSLLADQGIRTARHWINFGVNREAFLSRARCLPGRSRFSRRGERGASDCLVPAASKKNAASTLDAVLIGQDDLAILFSFTRAYFRVDTECPYELVRSLRELMPRKAPDRSL